MYVLVENNSRIHLGPMYWNRLMLQNYISETFGIDFNVPPSCGTESIIVSDTIKIMPAIVQHPEEINGRIEQYSGPFWVFHDNVAVGTYTTAPKDLTMIANELKAAVADERWKREVEGTTVNIQGIDVFISTDRNDRDTYYRLMQLMNPGDTRAWKFNEGWITLTYDDVRTIVQAIDTHVNKWFNWEQQKHLEIETATTHLDYDKINTSTSE